MTGLSDIAVAAAGLVVCALLAGTVQAADITKPVALRRAQAAAHPVESRGLPPPAAAEPAQRDPMDVLRERLAEKLGAAKAPEAKSPYVMQVSSKAESGAAAGAAGAAARDSAAAAPAPRPRKTVAEPSAAEIVAKLRQEKGSDRLHAAHWGYAGAGGPDDWARMNPEFAKCGNGQRQSPIDIRGGIKVDLDPVQFDYKPSAFSVIDNGHTVQVNVEGGNTIEVQGRRYDLQQFHFHRPSEERIDGRQFDMSAHLVHKDSEGRMAVIAVLLDRGSAHAVVQQVWNNLPLEKGEALAARAPIDLTRLLPEDKRYFTYMGSLTTPPCNEGVLWMVMQQPVPISTEQIGVFTRLYPMNARPIQSASGRLIKQSN